MTAVLNPDEFDHSSEETLWLTPEEAKMLLEHNVRNRPITELHVRKLLADMTAGRWKYNGEPLKFSDKLELLDGQHRLEALSRMPAGTSIKFLVVYGLRGDTQHTMDHGRKRQAADALVLEGLTGKNSAKAITAASRVYMVWSENRLFTDKSNTITDAEIVEWVSEHPTEIAIMDAIGSWPLRKLRCRPAVTTAVLTGLTLVNSAAAHTFGQQLIHGTNLDEGSPVLALRDRLDRQVGKRISDREVIGMMIVAWNAWRRNRKLSKIQRPDGGFTTDNFPVPL